MSTSPSPSRAVLWTGRVLSALPVAMLLMSGTMKILQPPEVVEGFVKYGYAETVIRPLGIVEVACALLFAIPPTSVLGAVLGTAYLGGAVATHVRAGEPFVAPIVIAVIAWVGIGLRDPRLQALLPLRK